MRSRSFSILWVGILLTVTACAPFRTQIPTTTPPPLPSGASIRGVFEGITPCSNLTRPLPQIPQDTDCELMAWKIVFYQDSVTGAPTTYILESAYGISQANTTSPAGGGTAISMEGTWAIANGIKTDPDAEVYQLYTEDAQVAVSFVKISEDILHVLNQEKTLMLGNAAWSYTLNRTDYQIPAPGNEPVSSGPESTRPPIPEMPAGSSVVGVFEGRLPCHEVVFDVLNVAPFPGCLKLKSRLTLYQNQATGAPSTYLYMGTSTIREGTWTIIQSPESGPDAVIYQLDLDGTQESVSFLKVDENHLFLLDRTLNLLAGNAQFSYTLSRIENNSK
jgi:hypothetical protein